VLSEGGREDQQGMAFPRLCGCSRRFGDTFTGAGCGIPAIRSDEELAIELLIAKSVHLHPGNFYDFPSGGFLAVGLFNPTVRTLRRGWPTRSLFYGENASFLSRSRHATHYEDSSRHP